MAENTDTAEQQKVRNLVRMAQKGDDRAFEKLYQLFFPRLSRFVSYRVSHKETTEDILSHVFIKAWQALQDQVQIASFNSWVFTVARNLVIDHYRTRKEFADLTELENFIEYEDNVIEVIDLDIKTKELLAAMRHLTSDQQQVLRLKLIEGLDNEEIGAIIDKNPGTVRVIQHRAIVSLKKYLVPK